jgi:hypothetical protein
METLQIRFLGNVCNLTSAQAVGVDYQNLEARAVSMLGACRNKRP